MGGRGSQRQAAIKTRIYALTLGKVDENTPEIEEASVIIGMNLLGLEQTCIDH